MFHEANVAVSSPVNAKRPPVQNRWLGLLLRMAGHRTAMPAPTNRDAVRSRILSLGDAWRSEISCPSCVAWDSRPSCLIGARSDQVAVEHCIVRNRSSVIVCTRENQVPRV